MFLSPKKGNAHLLLLPPALQYSPLQELRPFLQLPVFMPVHHPPSDLQNILTAKRCYCALPVLHNRDRAGWQHLLLLQQPYVLIRLSGLQQGRKGVAQGEPALQRTY